MAQAAGGGRSVVRADDLTGGPAPGRGRQPLHWDDLVEEVRRLSVTDPVRAEAQASEALEVLTPLLADPGPRAHAAGHVARLRVHRARARHYRHDIAAHEDTLAALSLLAPDDGVLLYCDALNMHAISCGYIGDLQGQLECLDRGLALLVGTDLRDAVRQRVVLRHNLAVALYDLGDARGALALLEDVRDEAVALDEPRLQEWGYTSSVAAASYLVLGAEGTTPVTGAERVALVADVRQWTEAALEAAQRGIDRGDPAANRRGSSWCQARLAQIDGELETALAHARRTMDLVASLGELDTLIRATVLLGELLVELGRHEEAEPVLARVAYSDQRMGSTTSVMSWWLLSRSREARGDLTGALEAMRGYAAAVTAGREVRVQHTAAVNAARMRREELERERDRWRQTSLLEHRAARVDPLTGIGNRRAFTEAIARLAGGDAEVVLALFDLDHFKAVNDSFGHLVGDDVLCRVTDTMRDTLDDVVRPQDEVGLYRMGGEEFAVVLLRGDLTIDEASRLVDTVRRAVADLDLAGLSRTDDRQLRATTSVGFAMGVLGEGVSPAGALLRAADENLYRAKQAGRDRTVGPA